MTFLLPPPPPVEFRIDFAHWAGVPLLKTKFGVYATPFSPQEELVRSLDLVREIGVRDFRYELAWGKPDAVAYDAIGGTASALTYDFTYADAVLDRARTLGIRPLLALSYCPTPLQTRTEWARWKDVPKDLGAWRTINRTFVAHLKARGLSDVRYEAWNEPDMPEAKGKMFFEGTPEDYARVYEATAAGVRAADPDALVGGPAAAYDLRYLAPVLAGTADFASIHAYANYPGQIEAMRKALASRPDLPILLTEYASFTDFRKNGPALRAEAAAAFFRDADGLLALTDVTKVYWAQWIDDDLGMISRKGRRRAIYNAFRLYGMMPTDRVSAIPTERAEGLTVLASASKGEAAVVVANPTDEARTVRLRFSRTPVTGRWETMRIDRRHASFEDDPSTEALRVEDRPPIESTWQGTVPAQGVVFLRAGRAPTLRLPEGHVVREWRRFEERAGKSYADFDPATWTVRLGGEDSRLGVEVEGLDACRMAMESQGSGPSPSLRIDYRSGKRGYTRAFVYGPVGKPPAWGTGRTADGRTDRLGKRLDLRRNAPPDWDGRAILTFDGRGAARHRIAFSR